MSTNKNSLALTDKKLKKKSKQNGASTMSKTKTVTVNRPATIIQGALNGFTGNVVAYDYPENEVIVQLDDGFGTNITVKSEMIEQPDKFGNKQSEQLTAFALRTEDDIRSFIHDLDKHTTAVRNKMKTAHWQDAQTPLDMINENNHKISALRWVLGEHSRFD